jgi:dienelactone hydrolase
VDASELRYDDLVDRVEILYHDGRHQAAVELVDAQSDGLEVWAAELAHLKACLLGASGDADGALRVLTDASTAGAWWRPAILTDDDDLAGLQDRPEFLDLIRVSESRVADEPVAPLIALPPGQSVAGIVVALHGAGQRVGHARRDWAGVLELGYALVCVQSSYLMSPMYRTWPDREQACADIARALADLPVELGRLPVLAAGFSAGGRVAVDWALTGRPAPVAGVLAVAPALRELPAERTPLSPATIWIGADDDLLEVVDGAADQLPGFTIERIPGLGHAFPADFAERLARTVGG